MSRLRLILLSLAAVFAVSAVASASASAAKCGSETEESIPVYCIEEPGSPVVFNDDFGEETISSEGGVFKLEAEGGPNIECKNETDTATINQPAAKEVAGKDSNVKITFTNCSVVENPKCIVQDNSQKIPGTIAVGPVESELKLVGTKVYDRFFTASKTFVTLEILNKGTAKCLVVGSPFKVVGESCGETEQTPNVTSVLKNTKLIEEACKAEKLKLGNKNAFLIGESKQKLTGARKTDRWFTAIS